MQTDDVSSKIVENARQKVDGWFTQSLKISRAYHFAYFCTGWTHKLWVVSLWREKMRCMPSVRIEITIKYLLKSEEQHLIARLLRQRESRKD